MNCEAVGKEEKSEAGFSDSHIQCFITVIYLDALMRSGRSEWCKVG